MNDLIKMTESEQVFTRAAEAYHNFRQQITDLEEKLHEATIALEQRNARIEQLERAIREDSDRHELYAQQLYTRMQAVETQRDEANLERDQMRIIFHSLAVQLEAFRLPLMSAPRKERRRRTDATHQTVPDIPSEIGITNHEQEDTNHAQS